ncbi:MAG: methyl-accepting chemotaxis protein, partial [Candidatus Pelethousia sp.]|nr:methyl-accepting chemotaxis protein [Candidatus Pelethousia sp.]
MKNLSIGVKLIIGYFVILLLLSASGFLSVINIANIGSQIDLYGNYTVPNAEHIRVMQVSMRAILHELAEAVIATDQNDVKLSIDAAGEYGKDVLAELDAYEANQRNTDRAADLQTIRELIAKAAATRATLSELLLSDSESNHNTALSLYLNQYKPVISQALTILDTFAATAMDNADVQHAEALRIVSLARTEIIILCVVSLGMTVVIILVTRRSLLVPIKEIMGAYEEISRGNLNAQIKYESNDEIGRMAKLIQRTNAMQSVVLGDVIDKLVKISQGDLQAKVEVEYPGDFMILKDAIEKTTSALNKIMRTINTTSEQVSAGASQVAGGAQALAAGSTEQASSVEELNASVVLIAEQAAENEANVKRANNFVEQADEGVAASNEHMQQLSAAMAEIGSASNQIASITKVIEDIAFQTNIL